MLATSENNKREIYLQKKRESHKRNRETERVAVQKYRLEHKDKIKENSKRYYWENKDKFAWYSKRYELSSKGKYRTYLRASERRNLCFKLTFDKFMEYWQKPCHYCGSSIDTIGLDRIDNSFGYTLENVVSCCYTCNWMKRNLKLEDFVGHCRKIVAMHAAGRDSS